MSNKTNLSLKFKLINFLLNILLHKTKEEKIAIVHKNKIVWFIVSPEYLENIKSRNNIVISKKAEQKIEHDITSWFNANYDELKPTLDYLKDK